MARLGSLPQRLRQAGEGNEGRARAASQPGRGWWARRATSEQPFGAMLGAARSLVILLPDNQTTSECHQLSDHC